MYPLFAYAGVCCAACVMYQVIFTAITGVGGSRAFDIDIELLGTRMWLCHRGLPRVTRDGCPKTQGHERRA